MIQLKQKLESCNYSCTSSVRGMILSLIEAILASSMREKRICNLISANRTPAILRQSRPMNTPSHRPPHEPNSHTTWVPNGSPQPHSERAWPISHPNASHQGALSVDSLVWGRSSSQNYCYLYGPSTHATRPDSQQLLASGNQEPTHLRTSIGYNLTVLQLVPSSSARDIALLSHPLLDLL